MCNKFNEYHGGKLSEVVINSLKPFLEKIKFFFLNIFSLTCSLSLAAAFEVLANTITPPTGLSSLCTSPR